MRHPILLAALLGLGACQISPVITDPSDTRSDRYRDCERAARDYCRYAVEASESEMKKCVAEATFECVTAGTLSRSAR